MNLVACKSSPETIKILLAAVLSGKTLNAEFVDADGAAQFVPKRIPRLTIGSDVIFSSNVACCYLLDQLQNSESNFWLDVEAAILQPIASQLTSKLDETTLGTFKNVLSDMEKALSSQVYLTGNEISAADVCIWSTLFPILPDSKHQTEFFGDKKNILRWFDNILKLPHTVETLISSGFTNSAGSSLSVLNACHWFPPLGHYQKVTKSLSMESKLSEIVESKESPISEKEFESAKTAWNNSDLLRRSLKNNKGPVLPVANERNVLITSALPYVNNVPHLGNIIGCVLSGDVFARYCRLRGYNTLYVCGTDEYGTATETKALEEGLTPQQICDKYFLVHDAVYKWFNIKFDVFGRTTTPHQTEICQDLFLKIHKNGFIVQDSVEQLLCEKCDRYLADRFVEGICPFCSYDDARGDQCDGCGHLINATELIKPRCKLCQQTPVIRHSTQFFLDLPRIEPTLNTWLEQVSPQWSNNARVIARSWLRDGLKPRCITRDLKWGIPVPLDGFKDKVFYVWFDAPIGYISITKQYTEKWREWWLPDKNVKVSLYQFIGKDNVPFHAVMFPASLFATQQDYTIVQYIYATEYLNYEDGKFSKSRGVGVFGTDAQDTGIPADVWRFYLLYVRPESQDSNFCWIDLVTKNNSELLNNLGNFINRALMFAEKNLGGVIPEMDLITADYQLLASINRELTGYILSLEKGKLRDGIRSILSISKLGNQFMQSSQPWVLLKGSAEEKKRAETIIGLCCNISALLCSMSYPYMPHTADVLKKQLNLPDEVLTIEDKFTILLTPGHRLGKPSPLFSKIELSTVEKLKSQFGGRQRSKTPERQDVPGKGNSTAEMSVEELEIAIQQQGDIVRKMKSSGKEKSEWQPQVSILLDLKKRLSVAQANVKESQKPLKENQPNTSDKGINGQTKSNSENVNKNQPGTNQKQGEKKKKK